MNNKANNETVRTEQTKTEHTKHKVEFTHNEKFCNAVIIGLCVIFIILIIVCITRGCQSDIDPVNKAIVGEVETTSAENTIPTLNFTPAQEKDLSNASAVLSTSKDVGKSISLAMFTVISGLFMESANTYEGNVSAFLLPSKITLAISLLLGISALILLVLNRLKE